MMPQAIKTHKPKRLFKIVSKGGRNPDRTLSLNSKAWKNLRQIVLNNEPRCIVCLRLGKQTGATDIDHWDNDPSNNDLDNLVPLCHSCHSKMTAADSKGQSRESVIKVMIDSQKITSNQRRQTAAPPLEHTDAK